MDKHLVQRLQALNSCLGRSHILLNQVQRKLILLSRDLCGLEDTRFLVDKVHSGLFGFRGVVDQAVESLIELQEALGLQTDSIPPKTLLDSVLETMI